MKNTRQTVSIIFVILIIVSILSYPCNAVTIFESNGYKYSRSSSTTADVYGRTATEPDVVIPKDFSEYYVKNIVDSAFEHDENIVTVSFDKAILLERIGYYAFKDCTNLSGKVNFGGRINSIGVSAFENCKSLETVVFNSYITNISDQCFYNCSSLNKVVINSRVTSIGKYAFSNCTNLKEIEIPKSVTDIDSTAFNGDSELTIQCYKDSYAEQFAKENNIEFELLDPILGDANFEGSVDVRDVTALQKYKAGLTKLTKTGIRAADVTGDGEVSVRDATQVQRYLANIITDF